MEGPGLMAYAVKKIAWVKFPKLYHKDAMVL